MGGGVGILGSTMQAAAACARCRLETNIAAGRLGSAGTSRTFLSPGGSSPRQVLVTRIGGGQALSPPGGAGFDIRSEPEYGYNPRQFDESSDEDDVPEIWYEARAVLGDGHADGHADGAAEAAPAVPEEAAASAEAPKAPPRTPSPPPPPPPRLVVADAAGDFPSPTVATQMPLPGSPVPLPTVSAVPVAGRLPDVTPAWIPSSQNYPGSLDWSTPAPVESHNGHHEDILVPGLAARVAKAVEVVDRSQPAVRCSCPAAAAPAVPLLKVCRCTSQGPVPEWLKGEPAPGTRRYRLPAPRQQSNPLNLWQLIKEAVGRDLTRICLPVYFNEPISALQKAAEDLEYSELLDQAALLPPGSVERLLKVWTGAAWPMPCSPPLARTST